jgi:FKBP-type peptidyl-prolyl cis-trans isomerase
VPAVRKKYYTFWLRLLDFKTQDAYTTEKTVKQQQQQHLDSLAIVTYLSKLPHEQAKQDAYGNWIIRKQSGTGARIRPSDTVTLHYIGKLLNGEEFDNSYFRNQTFSFTVGSRQVIDGLDKGICNFSVGDMGTLIIPSRLGYGDKAVGKIPPNSVLIFELEIME